MDKHIFPNLLDLRELSDRYDLPDLPSLSELAGKIDMHQLTPKKLVSDLENLPAASKKFAEDLERRIEERRDAQSYSRIDELPTGFASRNLTEGCLVLEGGGFRGLYTAGVIDALMENDINMQATIGVSAGALYGFCYTGAQLGSARINLEYRHDDRYMGGRAIIKNHGIMGWDFLFDELALPTTEACRRFYDDARRFVAVVSNVNTGKAEYMEKGDRDHESCTDIIQAVCASASLPYLSEPVEMDGQLYLDGGCCDKIPVQWAIDEGYDKVVVVRTRDKQFRKEIKPQSATAAQVAFGKNHPEFAQALAESDEMYNRQCELVEQLEEEGRIFAITPSEPVDVSRLEGDVEKLGQLYHKGYADAMAVMDDLKAYLAG